MHDSDIVCEVIKHLLKAKPELKKQGKEPQAPKLFETLFKPTKFGNEYTDKRDLLKKKVQKLLLISTYKEERTDEEQAILTTFNKLANNIPFGTKEDKYRDELKKFVLKQFDILNIKYDLSAVTQALNDLLTLERKKTKNYSKIFSNWRKPGNAIDNDTLKDLLTSNFGIDPNIWTTTDDRNFQRVKITIQKKC